MSSDIGNVGQIYSWLSNPLSANPSKWSNTLKQFVGKLPTNCLSVFDHFVKLALKGVRCMNCSGKLYKQDKDARQKQSLK